MTSYTAFFVYNLVAFIAVLAFDLVICDSHLGDNKWVNAVLNAWAALTTLSIPLWLGYIFIYSFMLH